MYKKITHNIVEEQFDSFDSFKLSIKPKQAESEEMIKLRMDSRDYFSEFFWRLRIYLTSLIASPIDLPMAEEYIYRDIESIGSIVLPYYGDVAASNISLYMKNIMTSLVSIVNGIKSGKDITDLTTTATENVNVLAQYLSTLNPVMWQAYTTNDIFSKVINSFITQATSRMSKNWLQDFTATSLGLRALVTGTPSTQGFADIFARGIVQ